MPELAGANVYEALSSMLGSANQNIVMLVMGVFGLASLLFGYRLIKVFIFLIGFAVGAFVANLVHDSNVLFILLYGLCAGAIAIALWYLGIFLLGAICGLSLGVVLGINVTIVLLIFAIIGGILAIAIRKFMIIVSTSWNGASILAPILAYLFKITDSQIELFIALALTVVGIVFQYVTFKEKAVKESASAEQSKAEAGMEQ